MSPPDQARHPMQSEADSSPTNSGVFVAVRGDKGIYLRQQRKDKLIEHKRCINPHGQDKLEGRNWRRKVSKHMTAAPKA